MALLWFSSDRLWSFFKDRRRGQNRKKEKIESTMKRMRNDPEVLEKVMRDPKLLKEVEAKGFYISTQLQ